jgi:NagD protein
LDGVIYRENQLILGTVVFVQASSASGAPFLFLTNNAAPTGENLVVHLKRPGIHRLSPKNFYTPAMNTADFLSEADAGCSGFALGEGAVSMERVAKAHGCPETGDRLLATNPDNGCPVSPERTRPWTAATAAFLEASSGRRTYYLVKPNGSMFHRARKKLADVSRTEVEQVLMIGDPMETDIGGAIESDLPGHLVLTGSTRLENLGDNVSQPTRILESVVDFTEEVKTAKISDHLDIPAFANRTSASRRTGCVIGRTSSRSSSRVLGRP